MTPTSQAAGLVRRFLASHGRRHTFRAIDDLDAYRRWLHNTDTDTTWRQCRGLAGLTTDDALLDVVGHENPGLVAPDTDRRNSVLPEYEPGTVLVRDTANPTPAELTRVRLQGINLVSAAAREDLATIFQLSPRTVGDGAFLTVALAELAAELLTATGRDPVETIDDLRGQTIRDQDNGGRP